MNKSDNGLIRICYRTLRPFDGYYLNLAVIQNTLQGHTKSYRG